MTQEANEHGINLIIWDSKEIENYLINPNVIYRIIRQEKEISLDEIIKLIESILNKNKDNIICQFGQKIQEEDKSLGYTAITKKAIEIVESHWNSLDEKIKICSGKEILKSIKAEIQHKYKISFSNNKIAKSFKSNEINQDIIKFFHILYKD